MILIVVNKIHEYLSGRCWVTCRIIKDDLDLSKTVVHENLNCAGILTVEEDLCTNISNLGHLLVIAKGIMDSVKEKNHCRQMCDN